MDAKDLQARREKLKLTREQLAKELQTSAVTIWRWETGERRIPPYLSLAIETVERRHKPTRRAA